MISLFGLCLAGLSLEAQTIRATYTVVDTMKERSDWETSRLDQDRIEEQSATLVYSQGRSRFEGQRVIYFKDFREQTLLHQLYIEYKSYLVEGPLEAMDWKLTSQSDTLGRYSIRKAFLYHHEDTVQAWYAEQIPIPDGPYGYHGLPGLIVRLQDRHRQIALREVAVKKEKQVPEVPDKGYRLSRADFEAKLDKLNQRRQRRGQKAIRIR